MSRNQNSLLDQQQQFIMPVGAPSNVLDEMLRHFINEENGDPIAFGKTAYIHLLLETLGASAGIYSWPPAWEYGKGKSAFIKYSLVITNPLSNVLFLVKTTDDMLADISRELSAPAELKGMLNTTSARDLTIKYTKMFVGSIVCAVPFAVATYLFPLPGCDTDACLATIVGHSLVANTILHAVSWNFILQPQFWYYRIPFIPFEKIYHYLKQCVKSNEEIEVSILTQEKEKIYTKYRSQVTTSFQARIKTVIDARLNNSNPLARDMLVNSSSHESYLSFMEFKQSTDENNNTEEQTRLAAIFSWLHGVLSNGGISLFGAAFMLIGTVGWIANPFYIAWDGMGLDNYIDTTAVGFLPAYSTAILCAFYGSATFNQIYSYLTSWGDGIKAKVTPEARRFPFTFTLLLLINTYMSVFSYGTGQELIITIFEDEMWDDYRPYLEYLSIPALQILSFVPLLDLFNTLIRRCHAKFGSQNDEKIMTRLTLKGEVMAQRLQRVKGPLLIQSLKQYSDQQLEAIGIEAAEFKQECITLASKTKTLKGLKAQGSILRESKHSSGSWKLFGRGWSDSNDAHKQLLSDSDDASDIDMENSRSFSRSS